ncbi:MAG: isoprenoid biosynthesis glyoxalase ElbB [Rhodospirillales bacterium]|jgi:enhancing lycopene biosynthesis protein 2|nr:isoprenoid biosynthesis glyoxalase ElbB [Rhodospirillales bacterium]HIJ43730.1 isoprenoid biosynthesis glyoxalase ElbB [Rhodospirillaceae bacterium]MDP7214789.1 isoprenoid biosynthesis glyoxalase ElbB [Rhodospirillales bacterium]HIJ46136.1 isoprenoid biosynthesis glyoxalase ElbB [Rhodospirillaceae bacterium]HIJ93465.1 isoprenoid biosynthesis glyoxalase ElbB [Rhodospirillaceae bacterium]
MADAKPKIAVVLSGCGVFDGAEIHESVLTLLALDRHGANYQCYAPNIDQAHVVNHLSGEETAETRNVLVESARIARGDIKELKDFDAGSVDAVIFPGGYGAAKNLCTFAFDGPECSVNADVERVVRDMAAAKKPIGALCISPALIARILDGAQVTIGQDAKTAEAIEKMGGMHKPTRQGEIVVDTDRGLVTTPCYMLDSTIGQIAEGAENTVKAVLDLIKEGRVAA